MRTKILGFFIGLVISSQSAMGGVLIGNGGLTNNNYNYTNDVYDYLTAVMKELHTGVMLAVDSKNAGDLAEARETILISYQNALELGKLHRGTNAPLTIEALEKGIEMHLAFSGICGRDKKCQELEDRVAAAFLASYSQHIVEGIIPLDETYYVPYFSRCQRWSWSWWEDFLSDYAGAAEELLALYIGEGANQSLPNTLFRDEYEIGVGVIILKSVVESLNSDAFRRSYRFEIGEAISLLNYISRLNGAGRLKSATKRREVVQDLRFVANDIFDLLAGYQPYSEERIEFIDSPTCNLR